MGGMKMSPSQKRLVASAIALVMIVGFGYMYGYAIYLTWVATAAPIAFSPEYVYIATLLAGLVGGVAAMNFNENLPDDPAAKPAAGEPGAPSASGPGPGLAALVNSVVPQSPKRLQDLL